MADKEEVQDTSDYKLDKHGKKIKAHRIVFNKGEDDGSKGVSEQMKKTFNQFLEQHTSDLTEEQKNELVAELQEVLGKDDNAGKWISDFVHSDNPKFAGKSKEKRKQMALAAYYSAQRNEEVELDEAGPGGPLGYLSPEERAKEVARRKKALKANETPASKRFVDNAMKNIKPKNEETEVQELDEAVTVKKHNYSWGKMVTVHHGSENSYPLHPEHQEAIRKLKDGEHTSFKDETNRKVTAHREGDKVHLSGAGSNKKTTVAHSHFSESAELEEGWDDMLKASRESAEKKKTTTKTAHDVKKTSTGTVYTKQRDADGMSKEFNRSGEAAQKRGRGRPKKNSFGEAVEFLMGLDEETFDSLMEEGFDSFYETYENLDEVSKTTLGSYVKKAVSGMNGVAVQAHMAGNADSRTAIGKQHLEKARKRIAGIEKATDRLTK